MDNPASGKVMEKCGFRDTGYDFKSLESAMNSRLFYQHQDENLPQVVERLHEDLYLGGIITTSIEDSEDQSYVTLECVRKRNLHLRIQMSENG